MIHAMKNREKTGGGICGATALIFKLAVVKGTKRQRYIVAKRIIKYAVRQGLVTPS